MFEVRKNVARGGGYEKGGGVGNYFEDKFVHRGSRDEKPIVSVLHIRINFGL